MDESKVNSGLCLGVAAQGKGQRFDECTVNLRQQNSGLHP